MKIIGVSRGHQYSPNQVDNDAAIFRQVMEELLAKGASVTCCSESEFRRLPVEKGPVAVVGMARDMETLVRMEQWEEQGAVVINSPQGIRNCVRRPMTEILLQAGVPHPVSWLVGREESETTLWTFPCWIKRGDSHALVKADVSYVETPEEAGRVLTSFWQRGISSAVVNEHLEGDLVKFYGVMEHPFFYWFYPTVETHSKFGLEAINGEASGLPFDVKTLKAVADRAAAVLGVPVYGGDAVVTRTGEVKLIDFNDWPSFAPCRDEAAQAIAEYVLDALKG